jgi:hypothetical protein
VRRGGEIRYKTQTNQKQRELHILLAERKKKRKGKEI